MLERIAALTRRSSRAGAGPPSSNRGAEMYGFTVDKARLPPAPRGAAAAPIPDGVLAQS